LESRRRKNRQWRSVQSIIGATEKRRERACGVAISEGIGIWDGECEGWAVYQEWV
jgi:hypothetical protein